MKPFLDELDSKCKLYREELKTLKNQFDDLTFLLCQLSDKCSRIATSFGKLSELGLPSLPGSPLLGPGMLTQMTNSLKMTFYSWSNSLGHQNKHFTKVVTNTDLLLDSLKSLQKNLKIRREMGGQVADDICITEYVKAVDKLLKDELGRWIEAGRGEVKDTGDGQLNMDRIIKEASALSSPVSISLSKPTGFSGMSLFPVGK